MKTILLTLFLLLNQAKNVSPSNPPHGGVSGQPKHETQSSSTKPASSKQTANQASVVVPEMASGQANEEPATSKSEHDKDESKWKLSEKIAAVASLSAFLQCVALIVTIIVQIRYGRRELRAYVFQDASGMLTGNMLTPPIPALANRPGVGLTIKNTGQTPAYKVVSWAQIAVMFPHEENRLLVIPTLQNLSSHTLGSNGFFSKNMWFDRDLTAQEVADVQAGNRHIYVYGRVEYVDAFRKKRFTNFRLHYKGLFPPLPEAFFYYSDNGNDAN